MPNKIYFSRNADGYTCAYSSETHLCLDVIESTGDKPLTSEQRKTYVGEIDPKYSKK